jgi:hypothetical protein
VLIYLLRIGQHYHANCRCTLPSTSRSWRTHVSELRRGMPRLSQEGAEEEEGRKQNPAPAESRRCGSKCDSKVTLRSWKTSFRSTLYARMGAVRVIEAAAAEPHAGLWRSGGHHVQTELIGYEVCFDISVPVVTMSVVVVEVVYDSGIQMSESGAMSECSHATHRCSYLCPSYGGRLICNAQGAVGGYS